MWQQDRTDKVQGDGVRGSEGCSGISTSQTRSGGYLIAHEDDIEASDLWDELKAKSQPVSNGA